jgi:hypothetical protein
MTLDSFRASMASASPPGGLSPPLAALWHAGKGDWSEAHRLVQDEADAVSAWVHAHLHRQEGDLGNAGYWYRRAKKPTASGAIEAEWNEIARDLLDHSRSSTPP